LPTRFKPLHQVDGIGEAVRVRHVRTRALRRVATQRHDVPDAERPVVARDVEHFLAGRADAREVRRGRQRRFLEDTRDDLVGARRASSRRRRT
jgi:hypothetical protein